MIAMQVKGIFIYGCVVFAGDKRTRRINHLTPTADTCLRKTLPAYRCDIHVSGLMNISKYYIDNTQPINRYLYTYKYGVEV
jgi:hypothetical protein